MDKLESHFSPNDVRARDTRHGKDGMGSKKRRWFLKFNSGDFSSILISAH